MQYVTDRTEADLLLGTPKGVYGPEDLNRVEGNTAALALLAQALGVRLRLQAKTDWAAPSGMFSPDSWPAEGQMRRYLGNVRVVCDAFLVEHELPRTMQQLDWRGANEIERALQATEARMRAVMDAWRYSGELTAGDAD